MHADAIAVLQDVGGFATTAQLLTVMTRQQLDVQVKNGGLVRVWHGIYAAEEPNLLGRLAALDIFMRQRAIVCMGTAAVLYGFDTENTTAIHVLDPGVRMRSTVGLMVHQRAGAPLQRVAGRFATAPAWTAVEVARQLRRPRALATLDAALQSTAVQPYRKSKAPSQSSEAVAASRQCANSCPFADRRSESAMESEARLVMIDRGLPPPGAPIPDPRPRWRAVARRLRVATSPGGGRIRKHRLACGTRRNAP